MCYKLIRFQNKQQHTLGVCTDNYLIITVPCLIYTT